MPKAPLIMVLRHCEKPTEIYSGITKDGGESEPSLIVRGWQRAGALIRFFAPSSGPIASPGRASPSFLFAASPDAKGAESRDQSRREEETLGGLSDLLGLELDLTFGKGTGERGCISIECSSRSATGKRVNGLLGCEANLHTEY